MPHRHALPVTEVASPNNVRRNQSRPLRKLNQHLHLYLYLHLL